MKAKIIGKDDKQQRNQVQTSSSSSSKWEAPISDTQAVEISDFLMTNEEENIFCQEDGLDDNGTVPSTVRAQEGTTAEVETEDAPSWEHHWEADAQPAASPEDDEWAEGIAWLEDIKHNPRPGYQPFDDLLQTPFSNWRR